MKMDNITVVMKTMKFHREKMINVIKQNEELANKIEMMEERTSNLGTLKDTLSNLSEMENSNIDELEKYMEERQEILEENEVSKIHYPI